MCIGVIPLQVKRLVRELDHSVWCRGLECMSPGAVSALLHTPLRCEQGSTLALPYLPSA